MKKGLLLVLLILFSCQKDEILVIDQTPTYTMIFEKDGIVVNDGQNISFDVIETTQHQLIITTQTGSVLTKETFQPEVGINTRKIYTKILPNQTLILTLQNSSGIVDTTSIIVE
jgi:ketopantoate reductase